MSYGVEIWGLKEREKIEGLKVRYIRWVLGVERETPWYLVREETQREKLKGRAGRRAWRFEERLEDGRRRIARRCLEEMRERDGRGATGSKWEEERRVFQGEGI